MWEFLLTYYEDWKGLPKKPKNDPEALKIYNEILAFVESSEKKKVFPSSLSGLQRQQVHELADKFKIIHKSMNSGPNKHVELSKGTLEEFKGKYSSQMKIITFIHNFRITLFCYYSILLFS